MPPPAASAAADGQAATTAETAARSAEVLDLGGVEVDSRSRPAPASRIDGRTQASR